MEILVSYDVSTDSPTGRRRLTRMAKVCEKYGMRVQKSVFECLLTDAQVESLVDEVRRLLDPQVDSVRIYRLREPVADSVITLGRSAGLDIHKPLLA